MKKNLRKEGITLVALIVTIIILLILAGVTIMMLSGENGIISRAEVAIEKYKQAQAQEKLQLAINNLNIKKQNIIKLEELIEIEEKNIIISTINNLGETVEIFQDNEGKDYAIATVDGYSFKIYNNMQIELLDEVYENDYLSELKEKYVQDGLIVWYDGIYNNGENHDNNTTIWKNLAPITEDNIEGANDGTLMNFDYNDISGWTSNSLVLDGDDDWVKMSYLYYENMTVEIVAKTLNTETEKEYYYIGNAQSGGIGIVNKKTMNKNSGFTYLSGYTHMISEEDTELGKIYSMSIGYNGTKKYFRENEKIYSQDVDGTLGAPENNTVFAIGTNPDGDTNKLISGEVNAKIEVFSVRVYNRCLTEEEINKNYQADKERFEIEKEEFKLETLGYVQDGLVCLYDGEYNNFYNHDNRISTWIDLTKNNNNGTIFGIDYTQISGWTDKSLILDGIDDYVEMTDMHYSNTTVELVFKPITLKQDKYEFYLANCETGGIEIYKGLTNITSLGMYIDSGYKYVLSPNAIETNKIYSLSVGYTGEQQFLMENGQNYTTAITGTYKNPDASTVFMLATNPAGTSPGTVMTNMEVYSVRIYNRGLTEEERNRNYQIDKQRFSIIE